MIENDNKYILIDKYIYKKSNNKYRLFIRGGKYYYSCTCNSLEEAKRIRKVKLTEKIFVNNKKREIVLQLINLLIYGLTFII